MDRTANPSNECVRCKINIFVYFEMTNRFKDSVQREKEYIYTINHIYASDYVQIDREFVKWC